MKTKYFFNQFSGLLKILVPTIVTLGVINQTAAQTLQCHQIFRQSEVIGKSKKIQSFNIVGDPNSQLNWSRGSHLVHFSSLHQNNVMNLKSGKIINIGEDKPLFSAEGDSFALFSKMTQSVFLYSGPEMAKSVIQVKLDQIVDIRNQFVIGKKKESSGYYIVDLKTGREVYHAESADQIIKSNQTQEITFMTYPKIVSVTSKGKGSLETIYLPDLRHEVVNGHEIQFYKNHDDHFENYLMVQLSDQKSQMTLIRKSDSAQFQLPEKSLRVYDFKNDSQFYVVHSETQISIFKNGKIDFILPIGQTRDLKILGYSKLDAAFIGFDMEMKRLIKFTQFGTDKFTVDLGPKINSQFEAVRFINSLEILYQNENSEFYVWNMRTLKNTLVSVDFARGLSSDSKYVIQSLKNLKNWNLFEVLPPDYE